MKKKVAQKNQYKKLGYGLVESFLRTVTFYALKVQKTPLWQRVAGAPPWGLRLRKTSFLNFFKTR